MRIFKIDIKDNTIVDITPENVVGDAVAPQWSPNARQFAYYINGEILQIADRNGHNTVDIANRRSTEDIWDPFGEYPPQWAPTGDKLIFTNITDAGDWDIFVINVNGTGLTNLTNSIIGDDLSPIWSPDGSQIAFITNRDGNDEIYVMNADGSNPVNISNSPDTDEGNPKWRP